MANIHGDPLKRGTLIAQTSNVFDIVIVDRSATKFFKGVDRLLRFQVRQIRQIRKGGLPVLLNKVATLLMMAPAAVVLLVARVARPLVLIRFGVLNSGRMGNFARIPELYLCKLDTGAPGRRTMDIFFFNARRACNQQLKTMWGRTLLVSPFARWPHILAQRLPGFRSHVAPMGFDRGVLGLLERTAPHLSFTAEEEELGQAALRQLGIPEGAPFICFLARDPAYLDFHFQFGLEYNCRDSSIHSYVPAAEELTLRGYYALRMGALVREPLNTTNPMIVDYATKHRTDFLDIYLASKCRFFLGDTNGYTEVPILFRRPLALANFLYLDDIWTWGPNLLLIPKKLWLRKEHRFMTYREVLDAGAGRQNTEKFEQLGIEVVDNTPEEILAVAVETDDRLRGTWQTKEEDEELQRRFWSNFKFGEEVGVVVTRIGAEFLRQNRELLD